MEKILFKTLQNSQIYLNDKLILNYSKESFNFNNDDIWFINLENKKILISYIWDYKVIIYNDYLYNFWYFLKIFLYFFTFCLPFFIVFYLLWYFIIWKYFKVISQSIESLEEFSSNINHELKTPISEIISTLSLANEIWNYKEACEISLNSTLKLNKILQSIVWIASLQDLNYKKQRIDLVKSIKESILEFENEINLKQIKITTSFEKKSIYKKLNKDHLDICVKNILSNAIKYSQQKWKIEITLTKDLLIIKDYWIWIDTKNLKNIFKRYFRENYLENEGFWIGLNLVKKVCDINKWEIKIDSQKNKYSSFSIKFE